MGPPFKPDKKFVDIWKVSLIFHLYALAIKTCSTFSATSPFYILVLFVIKEHASSDGTF